MMTKTLLKALSSKAGECARLKREVAALQDDKADAVARYNNVMIAYSRLLNECMKTGEAV